MWSILWEFSGPQLVQLYSAMLQCSLQKHCPLDLQWHLQFSSSYLPCDKDEVGKMEPQGVDVPRDKMWQFYHKKIHVEFQSMGWSKREKDFFPGGVKKAKTEGGRAKYFFPHSLPLLNWSEISLQLKKTNSVNECQLPMLPHYSTKMLSA